MTDPAASVTSIEVPAAGVASDGSAYTLLDGSSTTFQFGSTTFSRDSAYGYRLVKQNANGGLAWAQVPATNAAYVNSMAVTGDGGVLLAASTGGGEVIAGQTVPGAHACDAPVTKISSTGAFEWMNCEPGIAESGWVNVGAVPGGAGASVAGGYLWTGPAAQFGSTLLPSRTDKRAYLSGLSASGAYTWALQADDVGDQTQGNSATAYPDGSGLLAGYMQGPTAKFGSTTLTTTGNAAFFAKGGPGGWQWAATAQFSGWANYLGNPPQVSIAADGSAYYTDRFTGTATLRSAAGTITVTSSGAADILVAKLNPDGTWAWGRNVGGSGEDAGRGISAVNTVCGIAVTGWFSGSVNFGSTPITSVTAKDMFLANIGEDGSWQWATRVGSSVAATWPDMAVTASPDGTITMAGMLGATPTTFGSLPVASGKVVSGRMLRFPCVAPQNVKATAGDGKATISWDAVPGGSITSYTVTAGPGGKSCTATAPATSCVIEGLTNGTTYTFKVVAVNAAGSGPESAEAKVTPAANAQEAAEENPKITIPAAVVTRGATLTSTVNPSVGGSVRVTATLAGRTACTVTRKATKAGRMKVTCTLNARTRAIITKKAVTLKVTARLTDAKGKTATASRNVRVARYVVRVPVTG